jgi:hypothetical protein
MQPFSSISRRRAIGTLFCSSAALALNLRCTAQAELPKNGLNFLAIGDFGTGGADQKRVAQAMAGFVSKHSLKPEALWLLGDNFYNEDKAGFRTESPRWTKEIEEMYPASVFPGPMHVVLGNHDYHDNPGGEKVQLAYAKKPGVRWNFPSKWYRLDLGGPKPLVTFLCLDSNLPKVSGGKPDKNGNVRACLTQEEMEAQLAWFKLELAKPRAPFTVVVAHHPLYSNGSHGDTRPLIDQWGGLLQDHKVHAYLCGHDHDLQHLELEGKFTSFVVSGGGGAKTRKLPSTRDVPFARDIHGFTCMSVTGEILRFTHYDADGAQLHTFQKKTDGMVVIG